VIGWKIFGGSTEPYTTVFAKIIQRLDLRTAAITKHE
jgi:hypothetical protein